MLPGRAPNSVCFANPLNLRAGQTLPPPHFCCSKHRTSAMCFSFSSFPKRSHCIWHTKGVVLLLILQPFFEASFYFATVVSVVGFWGPPGKQGWKSENSELVAGAVDVPNLPNLRPAGQAGLKIGRLGKSTAPQQFPSFPMFGPIPAT